MGQSLHGIEKGIAFYDENGDDVASVELFGVGAPGTTTEQDNAPIGSLYRDNDSGGSGHLYRKKSAGAGASTWERFATNSDLLAIKFRSERVKVVTGDVAPSEGGTIDLGTSPFGDDEGTTLAGADFAVNDFIIFGSGGTPVLGQVSNIAGDVLTITYLGFDALAEDDKFTASHYLPDSPDDQEGSALVLYNGTDIVKIGDIDWNFATGIGLAAPYVPGFGDITDADTVQSAIQKLDGNTDQILLALGLSQGAANFGTFSGNILSDNSSAKTLFQEIETYLEGLASPVETSQDGVTSAVTLDSVPVDSIAACKWLIYARLVSSPDNVKALELYALNDGVVGGADATDTDSTKYSRIKIGSNFNLQVSADVSGSGAAQVMRLRVQASAAVDVRATRIRVSQ